MPALNLNLPSDGLALRRPIWRFEGSVQGWRGALDELARSRATTALLPHQSWLSADAIVRVAWRRRVSHHKLLEWQTAEMTGAQAHHHTNKTLRQLLWIASLSAAFLMVRALTGKLDPIAFFQTVSLQGEHQYAAG